jgi:hypothetical protein
MAGSMDGAELVHQVRRRRPRARIIVLSGLKDGARQLLPDDSIVVPKPYRPEDLNDALFPYDQYRLRTASVRQ